MVTRETGTANIVDIDHGLLETLPAETLRLTVLNNEKLRNDPRNVFLFAPHIALTRINLSAPGFINIQYKTANGDASEKETISAVQRTQPRSGDGQPKDTLQTVTTNFDNTGKVTGGSITNSNQFGMQSGLYY